MVRLVGTAIRSALRISIRFFARAGLRACLGVALWQVTVGAGAVDGVIRGAGATFPHPILARWAADYQRASGVEIRYAPVGSGAGAEQIERRQVDFAATEVPLSLDQLQRLGLFQFPAVIGGVVPVVNISGVRSGALRLSAPVLADIYLGKIRKWNDRAIAELNPGLNLPSSNITVVHRADASGTSFLWSEFLSRASPEWRARMGAGPLLNWPVGVADVGNEGVAASVQRTRAAIGYVEYAYAVRHKLSVVSVRNHDGQFVVPSLAAFEAAMAASRRESSGDMSPLLLDAPGAASWPIAGASFILLRTPPDDAARTRAVLAFFDWALRRGQAAAAELAYVPVPDAAVARIQAGWAAQLRAADGAALWPPAHPTQ